VLLSRGPVWGSGAAYEYDGGDMGPLLAAALARHEWAPRRAAADRLLGFLTDHVLYGYGPAPLRRDAGALAGFLARFARAGASATRRERGLARFVTRTAPSVTS